MENLAEAVLPAASVGCVVLALSITRDSSNNAVFWAKKNPRHSKTALIEDSFSTNSMKWRKYSNQSPVFDNLVHLFISSHSVLKVVLTL